MTPHAIEIVPVMWVFYGWLALSAAYFLHGIARATEPAAASASPFAAERSAQARAAEIVKARFGGSGWANLVFANAVAGALLYYATQGNLWAAVFCALACLWMIYDCASSPLILRQLGASQVDALDWVYYGAGVVAWAYVLACLALRGFPDALA